MADRDRWLMIFDLSNPRTVEERVTTINKVKLFNIDQIAEIVERNIQARKSEIESAERIIEIEMRSVDAILRRMEAEPLIVSIFKEVEKIRERESTKAISLLSKKLGPEEIRIVKELSHALVEGVMSTPMNTLRKVMEADSKNDDIIKIAAKLFSYHEGL
jgi:glutamyl-tRNA reductase